MTKKLTLRHEILGELTTDELRSVAGGVTTGTGTATLPDNSVFQCPDLTGNYQTLPVWQCVVTNHDTW
jgi:hypothetical protein